MTGLSTLNVNYQAELSGVLIRLEAADYEIQGHRVQVCGICIHIILPEQGPKGGRGLTPEDPIWVRSNQRKAFLIVRTVLRMDCFGSYKLLINGDIQAQTR